MKFLAALLLATLFLTSTAHASEKKDYQAAADLYTKEAFEAFLQKYPKTRRRRSVEDSLARIGAEDFLWQKIQEAPTQSLIDQYMSPMLRQRHIAELGPYLAEIRRVAEGERQQRLNSREWDTGRPPQKCSWKCEGAACKDDVNPTLWGALMAYEHGAQKAGAQGEYAVTQNVNIVNSVYMYADKPFTCSYARDARSASDGGKFVQLTSCAEIGGEGVNTRVVAGERTETHISFLKPERLATWTRDCGKPLIE